MVIAYSWAGQDTGFIMPTLHDENGTYGGNFMWIVYQEFILTSFFMLTVQYVKNIGVTSDGVLGPFTVALTIFTLGNSGGPFSGGSMNPSVSISMLTLPALVDYEGQTYAEYLPAYLIGEFLAAIAIGF